MKKNPRSKSGSKSKLKNTYEVIELPSSNAEMEKYLESHRSEINHRILENIEYGIKMRMPVVKVFSFKNSSFVVLMNRKISGKIFKTSLSFPRRTKILKFAARPERLCKSWI
jgi:hypothetical protein